MKVSAVAYPNDQIVCNSCGIGDILTSIEIKGGVIEEVLFLQRGHYIPETLFVGDDRVPYLKKTTVNSG